MYHNLKFKDGSNPYVCFNELKLLEFFNNYEMTMDSFGEYTVVKPRQFKAYKSMKKAVRNWAIEYDWLFPSDSLSYDELIVMQGIFSKLGKKYRLLREFHENGIC